MVVLVETTVGVSPVEPALSATSLSTPTRIDGRRLRSERTKQLIIEAFLALLRDNPEMPTAVQIAERAGYSVRSIFERFPDLNALRVAATDYSLAQALALAPPRHADAADRQTRLRSQVETRAHTCERGVALWRVLLHFADQDETGQLKARVARGRETTIKRLSAAVREIPLDEAVVVQVVGTSHHDFAPRSARSFRAARNRWTRTVDSLRPVIALTSRGVQSP